MLKIIINNLNKNLVKFAIGPSIIVNEWHYNYKMSNLVDQNVSVYIPIHNIYCTIVE